MWTQVSKEVLDKAQYIVPLKKGELQIKYAEALVKIDKAIEHNKEIINQIKDFYRSTNDVIYSGATIIDIAERNLDILMEENNEK